MVTLSVKHCSSPTPYLLSMFKGRIFRCVWLGPNPAPTEALGNFRRNFLKWMLHQNSAFLKKPTQNRSDHKTFIEAVTVEFTGLSVTVTVVLLPVHLPALIEQPGWMWLWHCPPQLCPLPLQSPPQWLHWKKGPCLCSFSLHRSQRKMMAFSLNAPSCCGRGAHTLQAPRWLVTFARVGGNI